jgi:hypothetical protein
MVKPFRDFQSLPVHLLAGLMIDTSNPEKIDLFPLTTKVGRI